jgi:hypothetical protein
MQLQEINTGGSGGSDVNYMRLHMTTFNAGGS